MIKDTFLDGKQKKRTDGQRGPLPTSRAMTQVEPTGIGAKSETQKDGRLDTKVSVGKKPESYMCLPCEIEGLRPSKREMKYG